MKKTCRNCGKEIQEQSIYCLPCFIQCKKWLKQLQYKVRTFEEAGKNDNTGFQDEPAYDGRKKTYNTI